MNEKRIAKEREKENQRDTNKTIFSNIATIYSQLK